MAMEVTQVPLNAQSIDGIVPLVMRFFEENITKPDWRQREEAIYAFGSILEGPSPDNLRPIVEFALYFMLSALTTDPNSYVKGAAAWTLGKIFEFLSGATLDSPIITEEILTVLWRYSGEYCDDVLRTTLFGEEIFRSLLADHPTLAV